MPRKRPSRIRRDRRRPRFAFPPQLPRGVTIDLDRTGRSDVSPQLVAAALDQWGRVCRQSRQELGSADNVYAVYNGPDARDDVQRALDALPRRTACQLRGRVSALDRAFAAKTLPDPFADPRLPWWHRRITDLYSFPALQNDHDSAPN